MADPLSVRCETCGASTGQDCYDTEPRGGNGYDIEPWYEEPIVVAPHDARVRAAEAELDAHIDEIASREVFRG